MHSAQRLALALTLLSLATSIGAQQHGFPGLPAWLGKAAGSATSPANYGVMAQSNPFKFVAMLARMNLEEQRVVLAVAGEALRRQLDMACNIFGGTAACQALPADSKFVEQCKGHNLEIDCAYAATLDDDDALQRSPVDMFKDTLDRQQLEQIQSGCPQCFSNLQAMWCAQTVPKCGSFDSIVAGSILPAMQKATEASDRGKGTESAISAALPELLDAVSLSMPCREMCESVMATCACGDEPGHKFQTFGQLIEEVLSGYESRGGALARVPAGFKSALFGRVWDRPLCSLFSWRNATDFAGTCDTLPSTCLEKKWCRGKGGPNAFEQHMALQLAKTLYGWVGSPGGPGLFETRQAIIDKADSNDIAKLSDKYVRREDLPAGTAGSKTAQWSLGVVEVTFVGAMVVSIVLIGFMLWKKRQVAAAEAAFRQPQQEGYTGIPMASGVGPVDEERQGLL